MLIPIAAARPAPGDLFNDLLPVLAGLLGLAIVGIIVALIIRRIMRGSPDRSADVGFTLHDLRRMRDAGELSEEEFERARQAMIERVRDRPAAGSDESPEADLDDEADQPPADESNAAPNADHEHRSNARRDTGSDPDTDHQTPPGSGKPRG